MKRLLITALAVMSAFPLFAGNFGLGLIVDMRSYRLEYDDGFNSMDAERGGMNMGLRGYYFAESGWDYSLGMGLNLFDGDDRDGISPEVTVDYHQAGVALSAGLNRAVVSSGPFAAGLGGDLGCTVLMEPDGESATGYDRFLHLTFAAALPASLDINYARHFLVRLRGELITMEYTYFSYREKGVSIDWIEEERQIFFGRNFGIDFIVKF